MEDTFACAHIYKFSDLNLNFCVNEIQDCCLPSEIRSISSVSVKMNVYAKEKRKYKRREGIKNRSFDWLSVFFSTSVTHHPESTLIREQEHKHIIYSQGSMGSMWWSNTTWQKQGSLLWAKTMSHCTHTYTHSIMIQSGQSSTIWLSQFVLWQTPISLDR